MKSGNIQAWGSNTNVPNSTGYKPEYDDKTWNIESDNEGNLNYVNQIETAPYPDEIPHCAYCLCDVQDCLVKCPFTNKYFCNGKGRSQHSHIVHHLVKSRNMEFQLLDSNRFAKIPLVCYNCQSRNVFQLCFVQSLKQKSFYVFCRDCLNSPQFAAFQFDLENKQTIIKDGCILDWLVRQPTKEEEKNSFCSKITIQDMDLLEETWSKNTNASILDIPQIKQREKIPDTQLCYYNVRTYSYVFQKLIREESECARRKTESILIKDIDVEWIKGKGSSWSAKFQIPGAEALMKLGIGDEVKLSKDMNEYRGTVESVSDTEVVRTKFYFEPNFPPPKDVKTGYSLRLVWKDISYKRMFQALRNFSVKGSTKNIIKDIILGKIPSKINRRNIYNKIGNVPGLPDLNISQKNAISQALQLPFTLIQGPPGTGKTTTIAALVYHFLQNGRRPILVCGPSNITVEHLTKSINQTSSRVVRLMSWSLDGTESEVNNLSASTLAFKLSDELNQLHQKKQEEPLSNTEMNRYVRLREKLEEDIAKNADVITCTCDTSGSKRLKNIVFPVVIIDEVTQTVEPTTLIPILHGSDQVVLVGDHMQLGPTVTSSRALRAGFSITMVQRLVQLGIKPIRLLTQYRMQPALAEFPSNYFYDGLLENGVSALERTPKHRPFPFPNPNIPMLFCNSEGEEEQTDSYLSYINRFEAYIVSQIISKLCKSGVDPSQIGVITPYAGQRFYLRQFLNTAGDLPTDYYAHIEIASVDSFQGGECDYIIFSCVRNNNTTIGFLKDPRRINVAITRAKKGLMIIGSAKCLSKNNTWYSLIKHFQEKQLLVEGNDIDHLVPSPIVLEQPVIKQNEQNNVPLSTTGEKMVSVFHETISYDINDDDYYGH